MSSKEKIQQAMLAKVVYVGKDGITLKQAMVLANLGYRIIIK